MRIVFFGTPDYSRDVLHELYKTFKTKTEPNPIKAVVTQEPKPSGRQKYLQFSPVDDWAHKHKVPIYFDVRKLIKDNIEADVGILASYGEILPDIALTYFDHGILNIHPSLLPKYRGASPVQATLVSGDEMAGSTIIRLDEKMDHGPIVAQFEEEIESNDTTETLRKRLFERSTEVLIEALTPYTEGKINLRNQDHQKAVYTKLIKKQDGYIPFELFKSAMGGKSSKEKMIIPFIEDYSLIPSPQSLDRFIRAMKPWPIAFTVIRGADERLENKRLQILSAKLDNEKLVPVMVQLEGKNEVIWQQFTEAYNI